MSDKRVWFITGASRGMGASFVRAALHAGDAVVARARRVVDVERVFGGEPDVFAVALDVTSTDAATAAAEAAVDRFGRVDVLVNSAGA